MVWENDNHLGDVLFGSGLYGGGVSLIDVHEQFDIVLCGPVKPASWDLDDCIWSNPTRWTHF